MINFSQSVRLILLPAVAAFALAACNAGDGAANANGSAETAAPAAGAQDWTQTVVATPEGGWRMGNPDAKVKLVEFASFTCAHCTEFHRESQAELKGELMKSGQVSVEYRPFMLNIYDFAAVQLASCEGPEKAAAWQNELYDHHESWVEPFAKLTDTDMAPLRSLAPDQQLLGLARAGKLDQFARARGMTATKFEQCLTDQAALDKRMAGQSEAQTRYDIQGTPTFLLNGKKVDGTRWADIAPKVRAALR